LEDVDIAWKKFINPFILHPIATFVSDEKSRIVKNNLDGIINDVGNFDGTIYY
jgi:hypothetical protein